MKTIPITEEDYELLAHWASALRTMKNVWALLEDYQAGAPADEGRLQIALDELPMLIPVIDRLNEEAKRQCSREALSRPCKCGKPGKYILGICPECQEKRLK